MNPNDNDAINNNLENQRNRFDNLVNDQIINMMHKTVETGIPYPVLDFQDKIKESVKRKIEEEVLEEIKKGIEQGKIKEKIELISTTEIIQDKNKTSNSKLTEIETFEKDSTEAKALRIIQTKEYKDKIEQLAMDKLMDEKPSSIKPFVKYDLSNPQDNSMYKGVKSTLKNNLSRKEYKQLKKSAFEVKVEKNVFIKILRYFNKRHQKKYGKDNTEGFFYKRFEKRIQATNTATIFNESLDGKKQMKNVNIILNRISAKNEKKYLKLMKEMQDNKEDTIDFRKLTTKERTLIAGVNATISFASSFSAWSIANSIFGVAGVFNSSVTKDGLTQKGANLLGQGLFAGSVQATNSIVGAFANSIKSELSKYLPSYYKLNNMTNTLANPLKVQHLKKLIKKEFGSENLNSNNIELEKVQNKLLNRLGNSTYYWESTLGLKGKAPWYYGARVWRNFMNQRDRRRKFSFRESRDELLKKGKSKLYANIVSGLKKTWHTPVGILLSISANDFPEDFAGSLSKLVFKADSVVGSSVLASIVSGIFSFIGSFNTTSLNRMEPVSTKNKMKVTPKGVIKTGKKIFGNVYNTICDKNFYKDMMIKAVGRVSGRLLFEAFIKDFMYKEVKDLNIKDPNIKDPNIIDPSIKDPTMINADVNQHLLNATYQALRASIGQQGGICVAKKCHEEVCRKIEQLLNKKTNPDQKQDISENKEFCINVKEIIDLYCNNFDKVVEFMKNDLIKTQKEFDEMSKKHKNYKEKKALLKFKYNHVGNLLNVKMKVEKLQEAQKMLAEAEKTELMEENLNKCVQGYITNFSFLQLDIMPDIKDILGIVGSYYQAKEPEKLTNDVCKNMSFFLENEEKSIQQNPKLKSELANDVNLLNLVKPEKHERFVNNLQDNKIPEHELNNIPKKIKAKREIYHF